MSFLVNKNKLAITHSIANKKLKEEKDAKMVVDCVCGD